MPSNVCPGPEARRRTAPGKRPACAILRAGARVQGQRARRRYGHRRFTVPCRRARSLRGAGLAMRCRIDELATRLDLLTPRLQVVDEVQARLGGLHELSSEIDQKLAVAAEPPGRRGARTRVATVWRRRSAMRSRNCSLLEAAHSALAAIPDQIAAVQADLTGTRRSLASLQREEQAVAAQERRLTELDHSAGALVGRYHVTHSDPADHPNGVGRRRGPQGRGLQERSSRSRRVSGKRSNVCTKRTRCSSS